MSAAFVPCPSCSTTVSTATDVCPYCGYRLSRGRAPEPEDDGAMRMLGCGILLVLVIALVAVIVVMLSE